MSTAKELHAQALDLREKGQFEESILANDRALLAAANEGDIGEFAESVACLALTRRVRAGLTDDRMSLLLAEGEMQAGVNIVTEMGRSEDLVLPLYQLAQLQEALGKLHEAGITYQKAVTGMEQNPPPSHNRLSVIADMKVHMYTCKYKAGEADALPLAEAAFKELIDNPDPDSLNQHVWVSGGHMRFAEILRILDPQQAQYHLQEAKKIIDSDPRLKNREKQWAKLAASF